MNKIQIRLQYLASHLFYRFLYLSTIILRSVILVVLFRKMFPSFRVKGSLVLICFGDFSMRTLVLVNKAQQLLEGLQSADESVQLQAAIEMCQLLVMGNEDTLAGFPSKPVVTALIYLLKNENNYELMNLSCRALTYMMEVIPRSTSIVVEAAPIMLEKLQKIECMDVAEQSLTALEMLSKRHHRALLAAGAIQASLLFIDFFSLQAQRSALNIISNCCLSVTNSHLDSIVEVLPDLSNRIIVINDKKCVNSIVMSFSRLVENYHNDEFRLSQIVSNGLIENLQQLVCYLHFSAFHLTYKCCLICFRIYLKDTVLDVTV